jgi:hypothetical protein
MSAQEYQARADALLSSADVSVSSEMAVELKATAANWRQMADLAYLQDVIQAALAAREPSSLRAKP